MTAPLAEVLKDKSTRAVPGSWALFSVVAAGVVVVGILAYLLLKGLTDEQHHQFIAVGAIILITGVNVFLGYRMAPWLNQRVIFRLKEGHIKRACIRQNWWGKHKKSSIVYDLNTLTGVLCVGKADEKPGKDQAVLVARRLLLSFSIRETLLLSRANVTVSLKGVDREQKKKEIAKKQEEELTCWDKICHEIEDRYFPPALAAHWGNLDPYYRYRLLVHQAELAYLQAEATTFRMCLASLHTIRVWGTNVTKLAWGAILVAFLALIVAAGLRKAFPYVGLGEYVSEKGIEPWVWVLVAPALIFALISLAVDLFEPLSSRLQRDSDRVAMSDQLLQARVLKDDFDPILKFVKDDLERSQGDVTRYTVLAALTGALTQLFNQSMESWLSTGLLLIIASIFVLIQLYFYAQMQILRLISTVCLIAQSQAPAKIPSVDDYSMD